MTLNKKYTLYIVLGVFAAIIALVLAVFAFIPRDQIDNADGIQSSDILTTYQNAVHKSVSNGLIPDDVETFIMQMNLHLEPNKRLSYSDEKIISAEKDAWNNPIRFILEDNTVRILSLGPDNVRSDDDVSILIFVAYNEGGYTITSTSTLFNECLHLTKTSGGTLYPTCTENVSTAVSCNDCGLLLTSVLFPIGHDTSEIETCEDARCNRCNEVIDYNSHNFVIVNPSEETMCTQGTCNIRNTYYYTCQYCGKTGDEVYEYDFGDTHESAGIVSSRTVLGVQYLTLNCEHCNYEFFSISSEGYLGNVDDAFHSINVVTEEYVTYSANGSDYGYAKPEFKDPGTYIVFYRVEKDGRFIASSERVMINDLPEVVFGNYLMSTPELPHILNEAKFTIYGTINDQHKIEVFTINNKVVELGVDNNWSYDVELYGQDVYKLELYIRDIYGGETFVDQYFKYEFDDSLNSDLETETLVTETWHVHDTHVLLSGTVVNPNAIFEILVDDVPVNFASGTWSVYKDIEPNKENVVIIKTTDMSGFTSIKKINLCYSNEEPGLYIDANDLNAYYVPIRLGNPNMLPCHQISHIVVTGCSKQPTVMNGNTLNVHAGDGYLVYIKDDTKPSHIELRLPLNSSTENVVVDVYLTHGLHMQYNIALIWIEDIYFVGLSITETNMSTGTSISQNIYFPGYTP